MKFKTKKFNDLSVSELYDLLRLRSEIFVVEQNCVYLDQDDNDQKSLHVLGYAKNSKGVSKLIAYARIVPPGIIFKTVSIGRVVVDKKFRGKEYGYSLMEKAIKETIKKFKPEIISISAQKYLEKFYDSLGFKAIGKMYLEDNIPHIKMLLKHTSA
jgi:ElaA protein